MPVRIYEVKSEKEEADQAFKEAGVDVAKDGRSSVRERIGVAAFSARERAKARIRALPSYAKRKLAEEYSRQRAKAPERKGKLMKFLKEQAASGGRGQPVDFLGTGNRRGRTVGFFEDVNFGSTDRAPQTNFGESYPDFLGRKQARRSSRRSRGRRQTRRPAGFKWF